MVGFQLAAWVNARRLPCPNNQVKPDDENPTTAAYATESCANQMPYSVFPASNLSPGFPCRAEFGGKRFLFASVVNLRLEKRRAAPSPVNPGAGGGAG